MKEPNQIIADYAYAGTALREQFFAQNSDLIAQAAFAIALAIARKGKLLICGNGGSAGDSQHIAGEFINQFLLKRPALPAIALTTDTSVLTAIGNDASFEQIFARQIAALGNPGDVLLAISTSGNSPNILAAINAAREKSLSIIGLTGETGGKMAHICDILLAIPDKRTPLIQEVHLACEHLLCQLCDYYLFENPAEIAKALGQN